MFDPTLSSERVLRSAKEALTEEVTEGSSCSGKFPPHTLRNNLSALEEEEEQEEEKEVLEWVY